VPQQYNKYIKMNIQQKNLTAKIAEDVTILEPGKDFTDFPILLNNNKFEPSDIIAAKINDYYHQLIILELLYEHDNNYAYMVKYISYKPEEYINNIYLKKGVTYELIGAAYSQA
jgi:hypothetical protein